MEGVGWRVLGMWVVWGPMMLKMITNSFSAGTRIIPYSSRNARHGSIIHSQDRDISKHKEYQQRSDRKINSYPLVGTPTTRFPSNPFSSKRALFSYCSALIRRPQNKKGKRVLLVYLVLLTQFAKKTSGRSVAWLGDSTP